MGALLLILQLLPTVLQTVIAVERALRGQPGAVKKAVVMSAVTAAGAKQEEATAVNILVDALVGTLNKTEVFQEVTKK